MLHILIYDKLDDKRRPILGERRAIAAFTDEAAQQAYIEDAELDTERLKFDFFDASTEGLPLSAQPNDIVYAFYKKWTRTGPFELSGYSYTQSVERDAVGYDEFCVPVLIDKSFAEGEAWKEAAIRARLGTGREYRQAKKALESLPSQEREKREAEWMLEAAKQTYAAIKPKTKREASLVKLFTLLIPIAVLAWLFFIPEPPNVAENVESVPWLPDMSDVSYFRATDLIVFEGTTTQEGAEKIAGTTLKPTVSSKVNRYLMFMPTTIAVDGEAMSAEDVENWQNKFSLEVRNGRYVKLPDGSEFAYDVKTGRLYGSVRGETRERF